LAESKTVEVVIVLVMLEDGFLESRLKLRLNNILQYKNPNSGCNVYRFELNDERFILHCTDGGKFEGLGIKQAKQNS